MRGSVYTYFSDLFPKSESYRENLMFFPILLVILTNGVFLKTKYN